MFSSSPAVWIACIVLIFLWCINVHGHNAINKSCERREAEDDLIKSINAGLKENDASAKSAERKLRKGRIGC